MLTPTYLNSQEFETIYSKVPRLCVEVVIKTENGYLLTLRQKYGHEGKWHIPGGTVLYREPVYDAVRRIARKELGVDVSVEKLLGKIEFFNEKMKKGIGHSVSLAFLCEMKPGEIVLDDQASEFGYFHTLPENTISEHRSFLKSLHL